MKPRDSRSGHSDLTFLQLPKQPISCDFPDFGRAGRLRYDFERPAVIVSQSQHTYASVTGRLKARLAGFPLGQTNVSEIGTKQMVAGLFQRLPPVMFLKLDGPKRITVKKCEVHTAA